MIGPFVELEAHWRDCPHRGMTSLEQVFVERVFDECPHKYAQKRMLTKQCAERHRRRRLSVVNPHTQSDGGAGLRRSDLRAE